MYVNYVLLLLYRLHSKNPERTNCAPYACHVTTTDARDDKSIIKKLQILVSASDVPFYKITCSVLHANTVIHDYSCHWFSCESFSQGHACLVGKG